MKQDRKRPKDVSQVRRYALMCPGLWHSKRGDYRSSVVTKRAPSALARRPLAVNLFAGHRIDPVEETNCRRSSISGSVQVPKFRLHRIVRCENARIGATEMGESPNNGGGCDSPPNTSTATNRVTCTVYVDFAASRPVPSRTHCSSPVQGSDSNSRGCAIYRRNTRNSKVDTVRGIQWNGRVS